MKITLTISILIILLTSFVIKAEEEAHQGSNHVAIFAGAASNFEHKSTDFSLGADYEFRLPILHSYLGIGLFGEMVFAEHNEYLAGIPVFLHPYKGLKIYVAPGIAHLEKEAEIPENSEGIEEAVNEESISTETVNELLIRIGAGYDMHAGMFSITPTISADIINGHVTLVYGIGFGIGF